MWWKKKSSKEQPKFESIEQPKIGFKELIEIELQKMSKEQVVFFAWLSAVRVLPFIGAKGNFDFWKKGERKKHLYAIFCALDANLYLQIVARSEAAAAAADDAAATTAARAAAAAARVAYTAYTKPLT